MKNWSIRDAKKQLSHIVDLTQTDGPQVITRRGQRVAVILAANEFYKVFFPNEFLAPLKGSGIRLQRRRDFGRSTDTVLS